MLSAPFSPILAPPGPVKSPYLPRPPYYVGFDCTNTSVSNPIRTPQLSVPSRSSTRMGDVLTALCCVSFFLFVFIFALSHPFSLLLVPPGPANSPHLPSLPYYVKCDHTCTNALDPIKTLQLRIKTLQLSVPGQEKY